MVVAQLAVPKYSGHVVSAVSDETRYELIRLLEANPELSQREVARALGVSLGKANYCLRALTQRGLVKARNFKNSKNRAAYRYFLTPKGIEEKVLLALQFLKIKTREYELLRLEIEQLRKETKDGSSQF